MAKSDSEPVQCDPEVLQAVYDDNCYQEEA